MDNTEPKTFAFVLMPFEATFRDIYQFGIKGACTDAGTYCERLDEQIFTENMLDRIYNQIAKADLIVADMTGRNPNVFYETGYAHALGKRVILLTQRAEDIPFDLQHYPHIVYRGEITELRTELLKKVKALLAKPDQQVGPARMAIAFSIEGQDVRNCPVVRPHFTGIAPSLAGPFPLPLDIHYPATSYAPKETFHIGLVISSASGAVSGSSGGYGRSETAVTQYVLPDGKQIAFLNDTIVLNPGGLNKIPFYLSVRKMKEGERQEIDLAIRIFREWGAVDVPFRLSVVPTSKATPITGL